VHCLKHQVALVVFVAGVCPAGTLLTEGFDDVSSLPGWLIANNSAPNGSTSWFQGNSAIFPSQVGAPNAYAAANFLNAGPGGNISTWLISPVLTFNNGDIISFYTRTIANPAAAADHLELRLSTSGASSDVGNTSSSVGDFSETLLTINPALTLTGYPAAWTQFLASVSGLSEATSGRFAFRYSVPDTSVNGDYIGVDTVSVTSEIPEPTTVQNCAAGILGLVFLLRRRVSRERRIAQ
jgi:hypothetical protein